MVQLSTSACRLFRPTSISIFFFKYFVLCLVYFASSALLTAVGSPERKDLSPILKPIIEKYGIPGMVAAVIDSEEVIAIGAAGVRARGSSEKVTVRDLFHIGSDGKAMTATLIAQLVDKKLLKWDSTVIDVFPELKGKIHPKYNTLTLEQLLMHRGGLPANVDYEAIEEKANGDQVKGRQMAMEEVLKEKPEVDPGTFNYSNIGYVIAGHMAEKVAVRPWEDLMKKMIFLPLDMSSAGFGPPDARNNRQPRGHAEDGTPVSDDDYGDNPRTMGPAGTIHLAVEDWAKFVMLHLQGAEGKARFISPQSFKKMHTPVSNDSSDDSYAMGWGIEEVPDVEGPVLTHHGSNTYWYAVVWIAPKIDTAILVACNQGGDKAEAACDAAGKAIFKEMVNASEKEELPDNEELEDTN